MSNDPRVAALLTRRSRIRSEADRLDGMLTAYAGSATPVARQAAPVVSALKHYAMSDRALCGCETCAEWRLRQEEFVSALRFVPSGHRWSVCACPDCRFAGRLQLNYVAASNVRDLLIEMSYHAYYHSRHGSQVMAWFDQEMKLPRYTVDWCAYELSRRPVDEWLNLCERALSPVLSGAVFVPGEGAEEISVSSLIGSHLNSTYSAPSVVAA